MRVDDDGRRLTMKWERVDDEVGGGLPMKWEEG